MLPKRRKLWVYTLWGGVTGFVLGAIVTVGGFLPESVAGIFEIIFFAALTLALFFALFSGYLKRSASGALIPGLLVFVGAFFGFLLGIALTLTVVSMTAVALRSFLGAAS